MRTCSSLSFVLCAAALVAGACNAATEEIPFRDGQKPPAVAGECWCLFTIPAQFRTETYQEMCKPASCTYEVIPAVFETRTEKVCVQKERKNRIKIPAEYREETYQAQVCGEKTHKEKIPAVYEMREERVCVEKERKVSHKIPATFRTEEYQVCSSPARTEWRKTDCNAQNVNFDDKTMKMEKNECWCLVTIPASFETRTRQVCVEKEKCVEECIPARFETREKKVCVQKETCREVKIPAVFETRTRKVCVRKESETCEVIPAEFKTVEKQVCVKPESKRRIEIPAMFETKTREVCAAPARKVWRKVDCNVQNTSVEGDLQK
jgi:hypothetical protein